MSGDPLTIDGAWFVGIKADGHLDRNWPANGEGRTGHDAVMGDSAKIIKVVPARTARVLIEAIETERDAAEATIARVRNALAALDGHTWHEGHTDADHLAMHRAAVADVRAALEGAS